MSSYSQPGIVLTDHTFLVPLDHSDADGDQIEVFGREIVATGKDPDRLPWLVFLQGGPGFAAQRPVGRQQWLDRALDDYRVLLLDQRGTGRSSRISARTLAPLGSAEKQAEYLARFRADSIVLDAELIRRELTGGEPWSVLGQSFGGFCAVTYLSFAPHGMREALITGGLPGLDTRAEDVYRLTYRTCAARNTEHYDRYPGDVAAARQVAELLAGRDGVRLPGGARLTVEAFQAIGGLLGQAAGSHELHYLLVCREFANSEAPLAGNPRTEGPGGHVGVLEFGKSRRGCAVLRARHGHARVRGLVSLRYRPGGRRRADPSQGWPLAGRIPAAVFSRLCSRALFVFPSVLFPGGPPVRSAALACRSAPPVRRGAGRAPHGRGRVPGLVGGRGYRP